MSFVKEVSTNWISYQMQADLNCEIAEIIVQDINLDLSMPNQWSAVVFDLQSYRLHPKVLKILTPLGLQLRKLNKRMFALSKDKSISLLINQEGMKGILTPITELSEVSGRAPVKKPVRRLDVNFINPFIDGTIHVLNIQCMTQVVPQKPILKSHGRFECNVEIAGLIGINSKTFRGSIALCFPAEIFLGLMSKMLGEEFHEVTDDLKDGAAELMNIIFGHAKKILNENGHTIEKALPSVIHGKGLLVNHPNAGELIVLPFAVNQQIFYMEIGIDSDAAAA